MRKQLVAVAAVAAIVAVGIAILSERGAAAGGDDSVIRIVELAEVQKVIPPPSDGPVGTRYIFSSGIYDTAGQRIGRDGADCVQTNPDGTFHCVISVNLPQGALTSVALTRGTDRNVVTLSGCG